MAYQLVVSPKDIVSGRANITIGPKARIRLAHKAGAPWSEKDDKAKLHDLQQECLSRPERQKIIHGASRLGKSVLGGCEAIIEAMLPFTRTAIVAARYDHVSHEFQYVYEGIRRLFKGVPQAFTRLVYRHRQNYHDYEATSIWGSTVRGYSTDSDEGAALLGQEFTRVILGEGSHISQDILEKKVMRAIDSALMKRSDGSQRLSGYLSIYTTPKGYEGCSAAEYERVRKAGKGDMTAFELPKVPFASSVWIKEASILENPAYDRKVFEARKRSLSEAAFEEQYLGKMTFKSGRVYVEFDEARHVIEMPWAADIANMRFMVGLDTGAYFGAILLGLDKQERIWALAEAYTQKVKIKDSCVELRNAITKALAPALGTNEWDVVKERVDRFIIDPASQHKLEVMDELDITVSTPTRGQGKFDLIPTIDQVRYLFGQNKLFLVDDLTWTLDQIRKYIWKQTKSAGSKDPVIREPRKDYDHLMDALRFAAIPLWETGPYDTPPPPLTLEEGVDRYFKDRLHGEMRREMQMAERYNRRPQWLLE